MAPRYYLKISNLGPYGSHETSKTTKMAPLKFIYTQLQLNDHKQGKPNETSLHQIQ